MSEAEILIKNKIDSIAQSFGENANLKDVLYSVIIKEGHSDKSIRDMAVYENYIQLMKSKYKTVSDTYIDLACKFGLSTHTIQKIVITYAKKGV